MITVSRIKKSLQNEVFKKFHIPSFKIYAVKQIIMNSTFFENYGADYALSKENTVFKFGSEFEKGNHNV